MEQIGSHGLLISGVSGVGKSLALVALHRELVRQKIGTWRTDGMSLVMGAESPAFPTAYEYLTHALEQHFPELGSLIGHVTDQTSSTCAGVVLVDDLDVLFQSADGQTADGSNTLIPQLGSALLRLLDELSSCNSRLVVIGTTVSADANVPLVAKRTGRFGKILDLVVPTEQSRRDILRRHLVGLPLRSEEEEASTEKSAASLASRLAALTGGYVAKDFVRIFGWTDLLQAQQQVKPSQLRELNVASPGAPADGKLAFAGYAAVQKQLFEFVSWKFHPTAAMSRLGISNASGILLSGPSGCGKTLLVQTLAAQAKVNFVSVKSSELLSKFFGDSEKAVRQLFARARAASPCLLFFDEFDSIAHKRSFGAGDGGSSGGGVYARVLSTFLNEMDGVGSQRVTASSTSHSQGGILVVAATNRKNALDAALVRPGRIDKTIEIGYPTQEDVQDILLLYTRKMPLADDVNIQDLAARPRGSCSFTGADIAAVCKEAAFRALREDIEAKIVRSRHFEAAWDQRAAATPTYMTPLRTKQNPTDV
ncbi:cell division cycle protein 48 [Phytophthora infestans T30-4]|uniref:Cell division cycle protein 48 n=1 Tax=Phytophthora infestans (strain T30-4) TaxID=403677 RepID=D0N5H4_PHYIT|nr:cell division cycle protein 48 [Phytophthora infestans T30-4]EEY70132.1 cell division cycle protein 48 [Phytophthora infestans T30-4]|eukprot:XP_002998779.1 cell division cycle protein 48 [Phytophthora infestans T30-4]